MAACPRCGGDIADGARVCRHCLFVLDEAAWARHDAGRLGADDRGAGNEPEDPPVEPVPISGSGLAAGFTGGVGGVANAGLRLLGTGLLLKRRRRRQRAA